MPQIQVVDTTRDKPEPTGVEEFFSKLGKSFKERQDQNVVDTLIKDYKENRQNSTAWEDLQLGLEQSTISPTKRLETQKSLNEMKKLLIEQDKALNAKFRAHALTTEERKAQKQNLIKTGMPEWEADSYLDAPPGVKSRIQAYHLEQVARGLRTPLPADENAAIAQNQSEVPQESNIAAQGADQSSDFEIGKPEPSNEVPIQPSSLQRAQSPQQLPSKSQWPIIPPPAETTAAEREKIRVANQKENVKTLEENHKKARAIRDDQLALRRMQQLNDTGKLPSGLERWIAVNPETGDVSALAKRSGKINPETQAYVKEVNKFIRNAKDYYGARVTNFDLQTFLAQLPTLANTEQGRRLILKEMLQESQLQGIYANKVDQAIKHYGRNANMIDITRTVDDQIKDEEGELIRRMDLTLEAADLMNKMASNPKQYKNSVLVEKDGQFLSIPKEDLIEAESDGWKEY